MHRHERRVIRNTLASSTKAPVSTITNGRQFFVTVLLAVVGERLPVARNPSPPARTAAAGPRGLELAAVPVGVDVDRHRLAKRVHEAEPLPPHSSL